MNMCMSTGMSNIFWRMFGTVFPWLVVDNEHHSKMYPLSYHMSRLLEETGYMHIQSSKPDTVGTVFVRGLFQSGEHRYSINIKKTLIS